MVLIFMTVFYIKIHILKSDIHNNYRMLLIFWWTILNARGCKQVRKRLKLWYMCQGILWHILQWMCTQTAMWVSIHHWGMKQMAGYMWCVRSQYLSKGSHWPHWRQAWCLQVKAIHQDFLVECPVRVFVQSLDASVWLPRPFTYSYKDLDFSVWKLGEP